MNNIGKEGNLDLQREETVHNFQGKVRELFPQFTVTDRTEFDTYDPVADTNGRGQILKFYTEQGRGEEDPNMMFMFRPEGFVVNYYNSPEPTTPYTIRRRNSSFYGPKDRRWQSDELEYALETAKIRMNGVDLNDPLVRNQPIVWSTEEERMVTLGEKLDAYQEKRKQKKSFKGKMKERYQPPTSIWDLLDTNPEKATAVAKMRIQDGKDVNEARIKRELYRIDAYERLLRETGYL